MKLGRKGMASSWCYPLILFCQVHNHFKVSFVLSFTYQSCMRHTILNCGLREEMEYNKKFTGSVSDPVER